MDIQLSEIWVAAGVLLGFQVTAFAWRIDREVKVGESDLTWLPPADILNLISIVISLIGIFILPILGLNSITFIKYTFGLAILLFAGYPFVLAGHYDMYDNTSPRSKLYFPRQEEIAITIIAILAVVYIVIAFVRALF